MELLGSKWNSGKAQGKHVSGCLYSLQRCWSQYGVGDEVSGSGSTMLGLI